MGYDRQQRTLQKAVSFSGIGLHTAQQVHMRFCPAKAGAGIVFKRVDLPQKPLIHARIDRVCQTERSTTLGENGVKIHTVEHVLAALHAFQIDNLLIEVDAMEPPIGNGSSDVFVEMIEEAGVEEQEERVSVQRLKTPVHFSDRDIHIVALPSDEYRISYTLSHGNHPVLGSQFFSTPITAATFKEELAPCRTFCLYEEISALMDLGLIKGGSLDNAVVIKQDAVISKGGLFFPNEMVRHKILDVVGDLSLMGKPFLAHIIAIKAGHASNVAFAKCLHESLQNERLHI